jgi:hypothetical protein
LNRAIFLNQEREESDKIKIADDAANYKSTVKMSEHQLFKGIFKVPHESLLVKYSFVLCIQLAPNIGEIIP